ncbi:hypothetical protein AC1031_004740 [Aphanomyces cochlioides]|nr:hypothetical protein AC1031_004740 [Aphanomyces cochlioides]
MGNKSYHIDLQADLLLRPSPVPRSCLSSCLAALLPVPVLVVCFASFFFVSGVVIPSLLFGQSPAFSLSLVWLLSRLWCGSGVAACLWSGFSCRWFPACRRESVRYRALRRLDAAWLNHLSNNGLVFLSPFRCSLCLVSFLCLECFFLLFPRSINFVEQT